MINIIPDTNFLLQFRYIEEIKASDLGIDKEIQWIILAPVNRELDKNKYNSDDRIRKRVKRLATTIEKSIYRGSLENRTPLKLHNASSRLDCAEFNLRSDIPDENIVAHAMDFAATCKEEVRFISDDSMPRILARQHGLTVLTIPEDLRLNERPSALQLENIALKKKIATLENNPPSFQIEDVDLSPEFGRPLDQRLIGSYCIPIIEKEKVAYAQAQKARISIYPANSRFSSDCLRFEKEAREYFLERWAREQRSFPLQLTLRHTAGQTAHNVSIEIIVMRNAFDGALEYDFEKLPPEPRAPSAYENNHGQWFGSSLEAMYDYDSSSLQPLILNDVEHVVRQKITVGEEKSIVRFTLQRLQVERVIQLPVVHFTLNNEAVSNPFSIRIEIRSDNNDKVFTKSLIVRPSASTIKQAIWANSIVSDFK